jgi:hypothetical protein
VGVLGADDHSGAFLHLGNDESQGTRLEPNSFEMRNRKSSVRIATDKDGYFQIQVVRNGELVFNKP